jgi:aspartyl-tRNA(Asn)/glutamyl-tRNA(Gln) amidotransferase subunit A
LDTPYLGRVAGPMTRTVADAALLMAVISRPDARDWTALPPADLPWHDLGGAAPDVRGLRVGLLVDAGCGMPVDGEVARTITDVARIVEDAGGVVEPLSPFLTDELLHDLDTFWRVRSYNDYRQLRPEAQSRVLPFIRRWVDAAAGVSGAQVLACYQSIMEIQQRAVAATLPYDVVISPVAPVAAFPAEWPMPFGEEDRGMVHIGFTAPANMSGQPSISVNAGVTGDGRTIGLAITGRRFDDIGVLRTAAWWEAARPAAARPDWPIRRRTSRAGLTPSGAATSGPVTAG